MLKKRRVFIVLLHRGAQSLGQNRKVNGPRSYHWGLFISDNTLLLKFCPVKEGSYIDVTNSIQPFSDQPDLLNDQGKWYFRVQQMMPTTEPRLLCMVMVGTISSKISTEQLVSELQGVAVPQIDVKEQNCVWWVCNAIERLRFGGLMRVSCSDVSIEKDMLLRDVPAIADQGMELLKHGHVKELPVVKELN